MTNKKPPSLSMDDYLDFLKKSNKETSRLLEGEEKDKIYSILKLKDPIEMDITQKTFLKVYEHMGKIYNVQNNFDGTVTIEVIDNNS